MTRASAYLLLVICTFGWTLRVSGQVPVRDILGDIPADMRRVGEYLPPPVSPTYKLDSLAQIDQILAQPYLMESLGLTAEQASTIDALNVAVQLREFLYSRSQPDFSNLSEDPNAQGNVYLAYVKRKQTFFEDCLKSYEAKVKATLLPFQLQRIEQIQLQKSLKTGSFLSIFENENFGDEMKWRKIDSSEIAAKARELNAEYETELRALKEKYHKRMRGAWNRDEQKLIEEVFGPPWVPAENHR